MKIKEFVKKNKTIIATVAIAITSFYIGIDVGCRNTCKTISKNLTEQELDDLIKTLEK